MTAAINLADYKAAKQTEEKDVDNKETKYDFEQAIKQNELRKQKLAKLKSDNNTSVTKSYGLKPRAIKKPGGTPGSGSDGGGGAPASPT